MAAYPRRNSLIRKRLNWESYHDLSVEELWEKYLNANKRWKASANKDSEQFRKSHLKNLVVAMKITGESSSKLKVLKLLEHRELEHKIAHSNNEIKGLQEVVGISKVKLCNDNGIIKLYDTREEVEGILCTVNEGRIQQKCNTPFLHPLLLV